MVPIILGVVIQVFKLTSVHIAIRLVVYIITVLQHKGMNIFPSQNFDFSIRKVAVVTVIKQDFLLSWEAPYILVKRYIIMNQKSLSMQID